MQVPNRRLISATLARSHSESSLGARSSRILLIRIGTMRTLPDSPWTDAKYSSRSSCRNTSYVEMPS